MRRVGVAMALLALLALATGHLLASVAIWMLANLLILFDARRLA